MVVCLLSVAFGQVALDVAVLVQSTSLVDELLAVSVFERLDDPPATIGDEDPLREFQSSPLQLRQQFLADLVVLRRSLPEAQRELFPFTVHAKRDHKRLTAAVDRVEVHREERKILEAALLEVASAASLSPRPGGATPSSASHRTPCLRSSPSLRTCEPTSLEALALGVHPKSLRDF